MAQNAQNIHMGAARIWLGVTPPVGTPPAAWALHTNGVPGTGTEVGYTDGPTTFNYKSEKMEFKGEQAFGVIDLAIIDESAELKFTAQERTALNLRTAFDAYGYESVGGGIGIWGGGSTFAPLTQSIFLSSQRRDAPTKYEFLMLYKGINTNGITITWSRVTRSLMEITIKPIVDSTRATGDQVFQFRREL